MDINLVQDLLEGDYGKEDYGQLMTDAVALDRLLTNPDFKIYQRRLYKEMALVMRKACAADSNDVRCIVQGAMQQTERIIRMPEKTIDRAKKQVDNRQEDEGEAVVHPGGGERHAETIHPD